MLPRLNSVFEEFVDLCQRAVPTQSEHGVRPPFGSRATVCPACRDVAAHDRRFQLSTLSRLQDPANPLLAEDMPWDSVQWPSTAEYSTIP
jgi:hypothetical protein